MAIGAADTMLALDGTLFTPIELLLVHQPAHMSLMADVLPGLALAGVSALFPFAANEAAKPSGQADSRLESVVPKKDIEPDSIFYDRSEHRRGPIRLGTHL